MTKVAKSTRDYNDFYVSDEWLDETDTAREGANTFEVLAALKRGLRKQGYGEYEIQNILEEAQSGTYENLIDTVIKYAV